MVKDQIVDARNKKIARRLNELLFLCSKTKADVCRDLDIDQGSLTPWFKGYHAPRGETIDGLARALNPGWGTKETAHFIRTGERPHIEPLTPKPVTLSPGTYERVVEPTSEEPASVIEELFGKFLDRSNQVEGRCDQLDGRVNEQARNMGGMMSSFTGQIEKLHSTLMTNIGDLAGQARHHDERFKQGNDRLDGYERRADVADDRLTKAIDQLNQRLALMTERHDNFCTGMFDMAGRIISTIARSPHEEVSSQAEELVTTIEKYRLVYEEGKRRNGELAAN